MKHTYFMKEWQRSLNIYYNTILFLVFCYESSLKGFLAQKTKGIGKMIIQNSRTILFQYQRRKHILCFKSDSYDSTCLVETFRQQQQQKYNTPTHSPRKWVPKVSFHPCTTMTRHKIHPNHKHSGLDWLVVIYFYFLPLVKERKLLSWVIYLES